MFQVFQTCDRDACHQLGRRRASALLYFWFECMVGCELQSEGWMDFGHPNSPRQKRLSSQCWRAWHAQVRSLWSQKWMLDSGSGDSKAWCRTWQNCFFCWDPCQTWSVLEKGLMIMMGFLPNGGTRIQQDLDAFYGAFKAATYARGKKVVQRKLRARGLARRNAEKQVWSLAVLNLDFNGLAMIVMVHLMMTEGLEDLQLCYNVLVDALEAHGFQRWNKWFCHHSDCSTWDSAWASGGVVDNRKSLFSICTVNLMLVKDWQCWGDTRSAEEAAWIEWASNACNNQPGSKESTNQCIIKSTYYLLCLQQNLHQILCDSAASSNTHLMGFWRTNKGYGKHSFTVLFNSLKFMLCVFLTTHNHSIICNLRLNLVINSSSPYYSSSTMSKQNFTLPLH